MSMLSGYHADAKRLIDKAEKSKIFPICFRFLREAFDIVDKHNEHQNSKLMKETIARIFINKIPSIESVLINIKGINALDILLFIINLRDEITKEIEDNPESKDYFIGFISLFGIKFDDEYFEQILLLISKKISERKSKE